MSARESPGDPSSAFEPRLLALAERIRAAVGAALSDALGASAPHALDRPVAQGAGDLTFGLDVPAEAALSAWLDEEARRGPLSLLSEERGWRHLGPGRGGAPAPLAGFDHGGPRIVIDPVDGTRNLMADLRSAWTVIALCPPGAREPRLSDVTLGLACELPDSRAAHYRVLRARAGGGAVFELRAVADGRLARSAPLVADGDGRADHGYFPFFCYAPAMRPAVASLAADFFARLEREEGADPRHWYDDQYISNAGQLALLALGTYRMLADLRALLAARTAGPHITSKPYDSAGAILVAREAGCAVRSPAGAPLDFPLDATTPVSFVAYANQATRARLEPHLGAALAAAGVLAADA